MTRLIENADEAIDILAPVKQEGNARPLQVSGALYAGALMPAGVSGGTLIDRVVWIEYKKRNAPPWPSFRYSYTEFRRAFR